MCPPISAAQLALAALLADWPVLLQTLLTSALLVCVMTYAAMPLSTRLFGRWLYGPPGD
jgi:antibiotic biosynthesis monooxygenase (ABM) superfamily enzyme